MPHSTSSAIRSGPRRVLQPYSHGRALAYGAVSLCVQGFIERFNDGARHAEEDEEGCSICSGTVSSPENNAKLALIDLPCGHTFHEVCLTPWLSPLLLPPTTEDASWSNRDLEEGEIPQPGISQPHPGTDSSHSDEHDDDFGIQELPGFWQDSWAFAKDELPELRRGILSHSCPMCRRPAFRLKNCDHRFTLQLLRVSLRLCNLAYQCFRFTLPRDIGEQRKDTQKFLARRHEENVALGQHEVIPSPTDCGRLLTVARFNLHQEVLQYQEDHTLTQRELIPMVALCRFFEHFQLKHKYFRYFFDPDPNFNHQGKMVLSWAELDYWRKNLNRFLRELDFSIAVDEDSGKEGMRIEWLPEVFDWDDDHDSDGVLIWNTEDEEEEEEDEGEKDEEKGESNNAEEDEEVEEDVDMDSTG
ncbi:MAG: hypothetical protein Q9222_001321 [Ikaeria aurantiellina]